MALAIVELEYIDPPAMGSIFGVPIGTVDQALDIYKWARDDPDFSATMSCRLDGTETIQIDGRTADTVTASIDGSDRWIVYNNGKLTVFETSAEALTIYKLKT